MAQSSLVIDQGNLGIGTDAPLTAIHIKRDFEGIISTFESPHTKAIEFKNDTTLEARLQANSFGLDFFTSGDYNFYSGAYRNLNISGTGNNSELNIPSQFGTVYFRKFSNTSYNGYLGGSNITLRLRGPSYSNSSLSLGTAGSDKINIYGDQIDVIEETNFLERINTYDALWIRNSNRLNLLQELNSNSRYGISFWRDLGGILVSNAGMHYDPDLGLIQIGQHTFGSGLTISEFGQIGVGTNTPDATVHIRERNNEVPFLIKDVDQSDDWSLDIHNANHYLYLYHNGNLKGTFSNLNGNYNAVSDYRLKKDIVLIDPILDKIEAVGIYSYQFRNNTSSKRSYGYLAQEVKQLFPNAVNYDLEDDVYTLDYTQMSVLGIKAVQELNQEVKDLKKELEELKKLVHTLITKEDNSK